MAGRVFGQKLPDPATSQKLQLSAAWPAGPVRPPPNCRLRLTSQRLDVAGNIVGGGAGALVAETPRLAVDAARGARDYVAPMSQAGQERTAGQILAERASSPNEVMETLNGPVDTGMTVPESPATLQAQISQLGRERAVVMVPTGTPLPDNIPPGMRGVRTERGIYLYDPTKITEDAILRASRDGTENEILGLGPVSKQEAMSRAAAGETPVAVTERAPDGTELKAAAGTDRTADAQAASLQAQKTPGSTVAVETPDSVLRMRQAGPYELVSGSKPTTGQATGDMGLLSLEREMQTRHPADFQQRRADQNAARLDALGTIQPTGNPADVSAALRRQLADIDQSTNAAIERATEDARAHADAIGGTVPPEQRGTALRGALQDAENAAREHEDDLWRAVDPQGRLAISMGPVNAASDKVYGDLTAAARAGLAPTEKTILRVMSGYKGVEPFRELADLRSAVSSAMRYELRNVGRSPAYARLAAFRAGIEDAIGSAVEHAAAQESHAVARGEMSVQATIEANLRAEQNEWNRRRAETGTNFGENIERDAAAGSAAVSRSSRAQVSRGIRHDDAARDQGISPRIQADKVSGINEPSKPSLLQFLASHGGLGPDAELEAIGAHSHTVNVDGVGRRKLVRQGGWPLDYAREAAEEAGYLRGDHNGTSGVNDLLDAIDLEMRGKKRYPEGFEGTITKRENAARSEREQHEFDQHLRGYEDDLALAGHGEIGADVKQRAIELMANRRVDADTAVEHAFHQLEQEDQAAHNASFPGDRPQVTAATALQPNFDQAARERLNEATAATNERVRRYGQGPVGQALKTQGQKGNYRSLDASVPDSFFRPGPKGFEAVEALGRAVGDEHAQTMLRDTAAASLRQFAMKADGTLDPIRFASWQQKYSDALRALPGNLGDRFADAAHATDAIEHVAAIRRDALEAYQRNALGKLIDAHHPEDVTKTIGGVFSGRNPVGTMRDLVTQTANDPAAREGLRKAVADYITGRFISNTEAGTSGNSLIRADQFQEFLKQHTGSLRQVLSAPEYNMLKAIAADLRRSNRSLTAVKIPGQSNTMQDAVPELKKAMTPGSGSLLAQLVVAGGGGYGVHGVTGALTGIAGVLGKNVIGRMHEAGMEQVSDLIRQAMLDPELARVLLSKAPAKPDAGSAMTLAHRLRRLSVYAPTAMNPDQKAN